MFLKTVYSKLDLTLNFIDLEDLEESMDNLAWCENMYELYLTGNPCTHWEGYKDFVIAKVPTLKRLDGEDVNRSQKIQAQQKLKELEQELRQLVAENIEKKRLEKESGNENPDAYTKESRVAAYKEMQEKKEEEEKAKKQNSMFKDFDEF